MWALWNRAARQRPWFYATAAASSRFHRAGLLAGAALLVSVPERCIGATDMLSAQTVETLTFTNNVALAPREQARSDVSLAVSVPLRIREEGTRLKLDANYVPTAYFYARNSDLNDVQNNLTSLLSFEAVDDFFFVDATANITQSYISPFLSRPDSGASISQNRVQQTSLGLSPYIRHQTTRGWTYAVRNDNFWSTYDTNGLPNSAANRVSADVESPPARVRSAFDYNYLNSREQSQPSAYYEQVGRVRPILTMTPRLRASARAGYETNNYMEHYSGAVYGAGGDWTPTSRSKVDAWLEHRFFGPSYALNLSHHQRKTAFRLSATRDVYTAFDQPNILRPQLTSEVLDDALRLRIPDPVDREKAVKEMLQKAGVSPPLTQVYSFYTAQPYLATQWTASLAFIGRRDTAELRMYYQSNRAITAFTGPAFGVFADFNEFRQRGIELTLSHRLSLLSTVTLTGGRRYSIGLEPRTLAAASQAEGIENAARLSLTRQLSPKTEASVGLRWTNFRSDLTPYREVAALAVLAHRF